MKRKSVTFTAIAALLLCSSPVVAQDAATPTAQDNFDRIIKELQDPASKQVLVFAHRGGWRNEREYNAPENSLANLHKAIRLGYDGFETDVARTKDGHFVIMHDQTVDRTTNGTGKISDMTLSQVKDLRLKFNRAESPTDQKVPTFQELLTAGKDRIMFKLDLKCGVDYLPEILKVIANVGSLNQVIIRVGYNPKNASAVAQTLESDPRYKDAIVLFRCRAPMHVKTVVDDFAPAVIEILNAEKGLTDQMTEMADQILKSGARIEAHASKDPDDWQKQIDLGMRVLHTQKPLEMRDWLKSRKLHW